MLTNKILLLKPKYNDEKILGIIKKLKKDLQFLLLNKLSNLAVKYQLIKKEMLLYLKVVYFY